MDHYETLGVARTATKDEIQKAYHEMAVKYHPDANPGDAKSASRMAEINTAYQILRNPAKRKEYDLTLGGGGTARPQAPQPGSGPRPGPSPQPGGRRPSAGPMSDLLGGITPPEGSEGTAAATSYGGLHVLPAGSAPASISNLLYSPRMLELLQRMRREFDMVLIDTPPMLQMPDARVLGRLVDGVILVVRSARTTKETAAAASQRLADDGTRVLGTVLNEWDPRKTSSAGYGYGHGAYSYYGKRPGEG